MMAGQRNEFFGLNLNEALLNMRIHTLRMGCMVSQTLATSVNCI